jgi:predicted RNA-binding protein with EMAP domain
MCEKEGMVELKKKKKNLIRAPEGERKWNKSILAETMTENF